MRTGAQRGRSNAGVIAHAHVRVAPWALGRGRRSPQSLGSGPVRSRGSRWELSQGRGGEVERRTHGTEASIRRALAKGDKGILTEDLAFGPRPLEASVDAADNHRPLELSEDT